MSCGCALFTADCGSIVCATSGQIISTPVPVTTAVPCYSSVGSPCIGTPSQIPGSNPATTNTPLATSGPLGSLASIGTNFISSLAKTALAPGSALNRAVAGQPALTSNNLLILAGIAIVAIIA